MKTLSKSPRRRFNPLNDFFFYKIMGEKGMEVQLLAFLNAVLGRIGEDQFTSVEILENKTFSPEILGDKSITLDIRAVLQGSTRVNVEVQLRNRYNMDKRSLFYWGREFVKSLKAGKDYREVPDVIAINIVDFNFLPTQNYHTCFHLREDREPEVILTNSLEIHFINMVKYKKQRKKLGDFLNNDPLIRWLTWLNKNSPLELVEEVVKMDSAIQLADERLVYLSGDEDAIRAYEMRFKAMCDLTSMRNYAIETGHAKGFKRGMKKGMTEGLEKGMEKGMKKGMTEGLEKGMEKGMAEGLEKGHEEEKLEVARKMKTSNRPLVEIAQFTGLSLDTIQKL